MIKVLAHLLTISIFFLSISCIDSKQKKEVRNNDLTPIFRKLHAPDIGITFSNDLTETDTLNYFTYPYIYMGGGVAVGDVNNDGLNDLFFTGNMVSNKLYLNKGGLQFEDITLPAGIAGDNRWFTGVTMADVNADGFLDIYCLVAGQSDPTGNLLYINNGNNTFTESSMEYGLHDLGNSVDASFFDYDLDGDLDVYVANYPVTPFLYNSYDYKARMDRVTDLETDNLYRNDGGKFTKVTEEAGVKLYSLTLSVTVSDLNGDGWPDFYNSNDFGSPDCLYINNQDGTFTNRIKETTNHTAFYGMGVDIADFNNDGYMDILQMDMDAASNRRSKSNMASMNPLIVENMQKVGFHHQVMQNVLQMNTGMLQNGDIPKFSDVSRLSGISSTDWSWAPLFADLDNDGLKDIFISNGTRREINNKDYFANLRGEKKHKDSLLVKSLRIPSEKIDNYVYRNVGDLKFEVANEYWGISHKGFSNGAVYADLDNDGDLEIVTNNIDEYPSVFENTSADKNNYILVRFEGAEGNPSGLGSKVEIISDEVRQVQELTLSRGFQSSVAPELHFGLGKSDKISRLIVKWPNGKEQVLENIPVNQKLVLNYQNATEGLSSALSENVTFRMFESFPEDTLALYKHKENKYDDFKDEVLLPHKTSQFGPCIAIGDLNGDGLEDFYVGAAHKYPAGLFYQNNDGSFTQQKFKWLLQDRFHEDEGVLFFDPDQDGDLDIYVVSGGNEFRNQPHLLQDRLYINDGSGNFIRNRSAIPNFISSGSRAYAIDFDHDGDQDLFVGSRLVPGSYPYPADSYLLRNDSRNGQIKFSNATREVAPDLFNLGLVTAAQFIDIDQDGWEDMIVTGEWMNIKVFRNNQGRFEDYSEEAGLSDTRGWWFSLVAADFDQDGDQDLLAGNLGLNYKYQANKEETFDIYFNDFDKNNKGDIVLSYYNDGKKYPVRGRECSSQQIPNIKKKFGSYNEFAEATLEEVYGSSKLESGLHYQVRSFASAYLENDNGKFIRHDLPMAAQIAPVNQFLVQDFNGDGHLDAIAAGNLYASEVETPRADAGHGQLLLGDGKGNFQAVPAYVSGLFMPGDVKDFAAIKVGSQDYIISARNDDFLHLIRKVPVNKLALNPEMK